MYFSDCSKAGGPKNVDFPETTSGFFERKCERSVEGTDFSSLHPERIILAC